MCFKHFNLFSEVLINRAVSIGLKSLRTGRSIPSNMILLSPLGLRNTKLLINGFGLVDYMQINHFLIKLIDYRLWQANFNLLFRRIHISTLDNGLCAKALIFKCTLYVMHWARGFFDYLTWLNQLFMLKETSRALDIEILTLDRSCLDRQIKMSHVNEDLLLLSIWVSRIRATTCRIVHFLVWVFQIFIQFKLFLSSGIGFLEVLFRLLSSRSIQSLMSTLQRIGSVLGWLSPGLGFWFILETKLFTSQL